ncbi:MAG: hypothetical protein NXI32_26915, partial [bacterium]|nr:hypothetical protein [bacterium]
MLDLMDTLNHLTVSGLRLRVADDDTLSVVGDTVKLTPGLKAALVQHKATLVELHKPSDVDGAFERVSEYFNRKETHTKAMASPGFIGCVYCGGDNLVDGEVGLICDNCNRYCWFDT